MKNINKNYSNIALVVAAGSSERAGTNIPKQYVHVDNKAIINYTLQALYQSNMIDAVICVITENMLETYQQSVMQNPKLLPVVFGGKTRQESVYAGLLALVDYAPKNVFIHDAARPNIDNDIINNLVHNLGDNIGVCPALPITDSLRKADGSIIPREGVYCVQTPQLFDFQAIFKAHKQACDEKRHDFTDDIAVANHYGFKTAFVQGNEKNYKITYPNDIEKFMSEQIIKNQSTIYPDIRSATGYDVHRLIDGDGVIMGGIKIPCDYKLLGHSDADVLLHAITDALLGTITAQDIGYHFNPNDNRWKDADSKTFLRHAYGLVTEQKGIINFIDATIICEKPKISPYREAIQKNIADILNLPINRVSIKATTTEKLGFTGRAEGIAVQAIATIIIQN